MVSCETLRDPTNVMAPFSRAPLNLTVALFIAAFSWVWRCVCVCVCVFIKLHITAQSGLVILVILCPWQCVCVCVCVCVFIKLHITVQSGPVILNSHSMPLALILPRGDQ